MKVGPGLLYVTLTTGEVWEYSRIYCTKNLYIIYCNIIILHIFGLTNYRKVPQGAARCRQVPQGNHKRLKKILVGHKGHQGPSGDDKQH